MVDIGTSAPRRWWLLCGVGPGSSVGLCSLPMSSSEWSHNADPHTNMPFHYAHTLPRARLVLEPQAPP